MSSENVLGNEQLLATNLGLDPITAGFVDMDISSDLPQEGTEQPIAQLDDLNIDSPSGHEPSADTVESSELLFGAWDERLLLRMSMLGRGIGETALKVPGAKSMGEGFKSISENYHKALDKIYSAGSAVGRTALMIPGAKKVARGAKHVEKGARTLGETYNSFCIDSYLQYTNADTRKERIVVVATATGTGTSQLADRLRLPEALSIPYAIEMAQKHGKLTGALALLSSVYVAQNIIGTLWGLGLKRFRGATDVFDKAYPGYKEYAAEENAGYIKTLYRQSIIGLGIGNSAFMGGEVMNDRGITTSGILEKSDRSSRRIAVAAGGILYLLWDKVQDNLDKSVGIPGVIDWTVPEVVENMQKASFWVATGFALDIGSRVLEKPVGKAVEIVGKVVGPPAKVVGRAGAKVFGPPAKVIARTGTKIFGPAVKKTSQVVNKVSSKFKKEKELI